MIVPDSSGTLAAQLKGLQDHASSQSRWNSRQDEPEPVISSPSTIMQSPIGTPGLGHHAEELSEMEAISNFKPGHVRRPHNPLFRVVPPEFQRRPTSSWLTASAFDSILDAYGGIVSLPPSPGINRPSHNLWSPHSPTFGQWLDSNSLELRLDKECTGYCEDECRCSTVDATPTASSQQKRSAEEEDRPTRSRTSSLTFSNFVPPRFFPDLEKQMDTRIIEGCLTRRESMRETRGRRALKQRQNSFSVVLDEHSHQRRAERARTCVPTMDEAHQRRTRAVTLLEETAHGQVDESSGDSSYGDSLALEQIGESLMGSDGDKEFSIDDSEVVAFMADKEPEHHKCFRLDKEDASSLSSTPESHQAVLELAASDSVGGLGKVKMLDLRLSDPEEDEVHVA